MDVTVSYLNKRVALQLPAELPLGLVFVVGNVEEYSPLAAGFKADQFFIAEGQYRLQCRLSKRLLAEVSLNEGDLIRAGGHLAFDPIKAGYYLEARDLEVLEEYRLPHASVSTAIGDDSKVVALEPADMPSWVQELAPPEIRAQMAARAIAMAAAKAAKNRPEELSYDSELAEILGLAKEPIIDSATEDIEPSAEMDDEPSWEMLVDAEASLAYPAEEPALANLSDDVIAFLSEAMDSEEDMELTPALMAELSGQRPSGDGQIETLLANEPDQTDGQVLQTYDIEQDLESATESDRPDLVEKTTSDVVEELVERDDPEYEEDTTLEQEDAAEAVTVTKVGDPDYEVEEQVEPEATAAELSATELSAAELSATELSASDASATVSDLAPIDESKAGDETPLKLEAKSELPADAQLDASEVEPTAPEPPSSKQQGKENVIPWYVIVLVVWLFFAILGGFALYIRFALL